jgi:hypothetical protein
VRPVADDEVMVVPDYGGACLSSVVPALLDRRRGLPAWMGPGLEGLAGATQVVLLVLDGVGWAQIQSRRHELTWLGAGRGGPITSVAPTTTATALTSITTGCTPAEHGMVGYRMAVGAEGGPPDDVLNVLQWRIGAADARRLLPATALQRRPPFMGAGAVVLTRADFAPTGFTAAHLHGSRLVGWRVPSTLVVEARRVLAEGAPFVYAYYDGLDKVAHEHGLGDHYAAELQTVDRLVGDLTGVLPPGAALVVTSDHGQVEVGGNARLPAPELMAVTTLFSGEGRFRWLHARPGAADDLHKAAEELHGGEAWVRTRRQLVDDGVFGGRLPPEVEARLGDVALLAREPVAFLDPADTGETRLAARHGSLTGDEVWVPLLTWAP